MRGAGLVHALCQTGAQAHLLVDHDATDAAKRLPACPLISLSRTNEPRRLSEQLIESIHQTGADTLIADTFPEGILGELSAELHVRSRICLLRLRRDSHTTTFSTAVSAYDHALDLEPHLRWLPPTLSATAWGPATRPDSGPSHGRSPTDVLLVADDDEAARFYLRMRRRLQHRGCSVSLLLRGALVQPDTPPTPAFPLRWADFRPQVVVGAAGFNLTYEAALHGAHHLAVPRPRRFDDQLRRAQAVAEVPVSPDELERRVLEILQTGEQRPSSPFAIRTHQQLARTVLDLTSPG